MEKAMQTFRLIILLMLISLQLNATIKYVAASGGDNGNDGGSGSPWATLAYAVTAVSSGDTIYMQAGTHTINTLVTIPIGIHLIGAGDTSIITSTAFANEGTYMISLRSATLSDGNQTISYLKFDGNDQTVSRCLDILKRHNVKIHHCTFVDFKYEGIVWGGDGTGNVGVDPPGYDEDTPPTAYVTGSEFHDNTMTSCSLYDSYGHGSLCLGGHEGMLIYNNTIECLTRISGNPGYCIKTQYPGFMRGMKVYNNTLSTGSNAWLFAIEGFFFYGCEFYNNTILGAIDINGTNKGAAPAYDYGAWIHDNIIGPAEASASAYEGNIFEFNTSDVIIERNIFRNLQTGLLFTPRTNCTVKDYQIRYNIFQNFKSGAYAVSGGTADGTFYFDNIRFYNNVFHGSPLWGLSLFGIWNKLYFQNNIFTASGWYWCGLRGKVAASDSIFIQNNILYGNAQSNGVLFETEATNYVNSGNITTSPLFASIGTDFTLQSGSPAIDAGLDVGLTTDYRNYVVPANSTPDIGAYEYNSIPSGDATPVTSITVSGAGGASTITTDGGTLQLSASVLPNDATNKNVTWSISNGTGSATISSGGLVTAVSDGTVTARATANDGSGVYDDMIITISNQAGEPDPPAATGGFKKSGNRFIKYNGKFIK